MNRTLDLHILYVWFHTCMCMCGLGGMQALEWALLGGPFVSAAVVIGCGAAHSAWQIAISSTQRQAIFADEKWRNGHIDPRWVDSPCYLTYTYIRTYDAYSQVEKCSVKAINQFWCCF